MWARIKKADSGLRKDKPKPSAVYPLLTSMYNVEISYWSDLIFFLTANALSEISPESL